MIAHGRAGTGPCGPAGRAPGRAGNSHRIVDEPGRLAAMTRGFAQLFLEVEAGRRPPKLLAPLMCPVLYARLSQVWRRPGPPGTVRSVHGCLVAAGTYEATIVVRRGRRVGAVGLRLERTTPGWRVTAAVRPEDGELPEPRYPVPTIEPDVFELVLGDDQDRSSPAAGWRNCAVGQ